MTISAYDIAATLLDPDPELETSDIEAGSLADFIRRAWPTIEPATEYLHNWHIDAICEYLEAVSTGDIKRLILNIPPRYMKSISVSVMWPVWSWTRQPSKRFVFSSYSSSLSIKHSVDRRTVIKSEWYQRRWGDVFRLSGDQDVKSEFQNNRRGHMIATSVKGSPTGKGGDVVVVDDPLNPDQAHSEAMRKTANDNFDQTLTTRLDNKKTGAMVVVMQRLHEQDLTGHLLEQGGWEHLKLPAVAHKRTVVLGPPPERRPIKAREVGDILWPEREGEAEIAQARTQLGGYGFSGQYDQDPSPAEGGMLKRAWWRFWLPPNWMPPIGTAYPEGARVLPDLEGLLQSWDMSFKDLKSSDFVAGQVWGWLGADRFLLDQFHDRMDFPATLKAVTNLSAKWPKTHAKLVEDKANGTAVIATLKSKVPGLLPINPEGGKEARAAAISPQVEAGNVYLPHPSVAPWVSSLIEEAAAFPNAANDDQVDSLTQALLWITLRAPSKATVSSAARRRI